MLFARFFKRGDREPTPGETRTPVQDAKPVQPEKNKPAGDTAAPPAQTETDSEIFAEMQQILGAGENVVRIPCRALLTVLPPEFQGEAYRADAIPADVFIELDRAELLNQLRAGRVAYPLHTLAKMLPDGWIKSDADTLVELHLPDVVQAVPEDLLRGADQLDEDTIEAAQMRDYFKPEPVEAETMEPASVPAPPDGVPPEQAAGPAGSAPEKKSEIVSPAPETSAAPRPNQRKKPAVPDWAWNGVETGPDAGAQAIDLNHAQVEDLIRIPGLGRVRAEHIVAWRKRHGLFHSIYDLADMPRIGRRLFMRATGLNPAVTKRKDRHEMLNARLGLDPALRPGLSELVQRMAKQLHLSGCVLSDAAGVVLASLAPDDPQAHMQAALAPKLFRRCRRYLRELDPQGRVIMLPDAQKPLVMVRSGGYYTSVVIQQGAEWQPTVEALMEIGIELEWLLEPRLVVRAPEPAGEGYDHA